MEMWNVCSNSIGMSNFLTSLYTIKVGCTQIFLQDDFVVLSVCCQSDCVMFVSVNQKVQRKKKRYPVVPRTFNSNLDIMQRVVLRSRDRFLKSDRKTALEQTSPCQTCNRPGWKFGYISSFQLRSFSQRIVGQSFGVGYVVFISGILQNETKWRTPKLCPTIHCNCYLEKSLWPGRSHLRSYAL